jgi:CDP-diacylglycerol--glycerol-3-phosphate 3-phosphatidyltransferase
MSVLRRFSLLPHSLPQRLVNPVALAIARTGVTPNTLTLLGFLGNLGAAVLVARGEFLAGGLVVLAASALDLLDGALARATGRVTRFGGVLDSVLDRLSEAAVLAALVFYYAGLHRREEVALAFAAAVGSMMVSYMRARAEGAGLDLREGLFTRPERVIVLALGLIIDQTRVALWILAVLANLTALQRLYVVWRRLVALPAEGESARPSEPPPHHNQGGAS